jgi:hypothetical protein
MINFELLCRHRPGRIKETTEVSVNTAGHQLIIATGTYRTQSRITARWTATFGFIMQIRVLLSISRYFHLI